MRAPDDAAVVVQARVGSSRLPGKVLMPIDGIPLVFHVLRRAAAIGAPVVLATSSDPSDDPLASACRGAGFEVSRGSATDVLDRYVRAVPSWARYVVRITADCPLFDPSIGRAVLDAARSGSADYVANVIVRTFPDGLDCEAFTVDALARAWRESVSPYQREHVTPYIREHPELFRLWNLSMVPDLSAERWTVDYADDLEFVRAVYARIRAEPEERRTSMHAVLASLVAHPELRALGDRLTGRVRSA